MPLIAQFPLNPTITNVIKHPNKETEDHQIHFTHSGNNLLYFNSRFIEFLKSDQLTVDTSFQKQVQLWLSREKETKTSLFAPNVSSNGTFCVAQLVSGRLLLWSSENRTIAEILPHPLSLNPTPITAPSRLSFWQKKTPSFSLPRPKKLFVSNDGHDVLYVTEANQLYFWHAPYGYDRQIIQKKISLFQFFNEQKESYQLDPPGVWLQIPNAGNVFTQKAPVTMIIVMDASCTVTAAQGRQWTVVWCGCDHDSMYKTTCHFNIQGNAIEKQGIWMWQLKFNVSFEQEQYSLQRENLDFATSTVIPREKQKTNWKETIESRLAESQQRLLYLMQKHQNKQSSNAPTTHEMKTIVTHVTLDSECQYTAVVTHLPQQAQQLNLWLIHKSSHARRLPLGQSLMTHFRLPLSAIQDPSLQVTDLLWHPNGHFLLLSTGRGTVSFISSLGEFIAMTVGVNQDPVPLMRLGLENSSDKKSKLKQWSAYKLAVRETQLAVLNANHIAVFELPCFKDAFNLLLGDAKPGWNLNQEETISLQDLFLVYPMLSDVELLPWQKLLFSWFDQQRDKWESFISVVDHLKWFNNAPCNRILLQFIWHAIHSVPSKVVVPRMILACQQSLEKGPTMLDAMWHYKWIPEEWKLEESKPIKLELSQAEKVYIQGDVTAALILFQKSFHYRQVFQCHLQQLQFHQAILLLSQINAMRQKPFPSHWQAEFQIESSSLEGVSDAESLFQTLAQCWVESVLLPKYLKHPIFQLPDPLGSKQVFERMAIETALLEISSIWKSAALIIEVLHVNNKTELRPFFLHFNHYHNLLWHVYVHSLTDVEKLANEIVSIESWSLLKWISTIQVMQHWHSDKIQSLLKLVQSKCMDKMKLSLAKIDDYLPESLEESKYWSEQALLFYIASHPRTEWHQLSWTPLTMHAYRSYLWEELFTCPKNKQRTLQRLLQCEKVEKLIPFQGHGLILKKLATWKLPKTFTDAFEKKCLSQLLDHLKQNRTFYQMADDAMLQEEFVYSLWRQLSTQTNQLALSEDTEVLNAIYPKSLFHFSNTSTSPRRENIDPIIERSSPVQELVQSLKEQEHFISVKENIKPRHESVKENMKATLNETSKENIALDLNSISKKEFPQSRPQTAQSHRGSDLLSEGEQVIALNEPSTLPELRLLELKLDEKSVQKETSQQKPIISNAATMSLPNGIAFSPLQVVSLMEAQQQLGTRLFSSLPATTTIRTTPIQPPYQSAPTIQRPPIRFIADTRLLQSFNRNEPKRPIQPTRLMIDHLTLLRPPTQRHYGLFTLPSRPVQSVKEFEISKMPNQATLIKNRLQDNHHLHSFDGTTSFSQ